MRKALFAGGVAHHAQPCQQEYSLVPLKHRSSLGLFCQAFRPLPLFPRQDNRLTRDADEMDRAFQTDAIFRSGVPRQFRQLQQRSCGRSGCRHRLSWPAQ
jgi:hypothetical protein